MLRARVPFAPHRTLLAPFSQLLFMPIPALLTCIGLPPARPGALGGRDFSTADPLASHSADAGTAGAAPPFFATRNVHSASDASQRQHPLGAASHRAGGDELVSESDAAAAVWAALHTAAEQLSDDESDADTSDASDSSSDSSGRVVLDASLASDPLAEPRAAMAAAHAPAVARAESCPADPIPSVAALPLGEYAKSPPSAALARRVFAAVPFERPTRQAGEGHSLRSVLLSLLASTDARLSALTGVLLLVIMQVGKGWPTTVAPTAILVPTRFMQASHVDATLLLRAGLLPRSLQRGALLLMRQRHVQNQAGTHSRVTHPGLPRRMQQALLGGPAADPHAEAAPSPRRFPSASLTSDDLLGQFSDVPILPPGVAQTMTAAAAGHASEPLASPHPSLYLGAGLGASWRNITESSTPVASSSSSGMAKHEGPAVGSNAAPLPPGKPTARFVETIAKLMQATPRPGLFAPRGGVTGRLGGGLGGIGGAAAAVVSRRSSETPSITTAYDLVPRDSTPRQPTGAVWSEAQRARGSIRSLIPRRRLSSFMTSADLAGAQGSAQTPLEQLAAGDGAPMDGGIRSWRVPPRVPDPTAPEGPTDVISLGDVELSVLHGGSDVDSSAAPHPHPATAALPKQAPSPRTPRHVSQGPSSRLPLHPAAAADTDASPPRPHRHRLAHAPAPAPPPPPDLRAEALTAQRRRDEVVDALLVALCRLPGLAPLHFRVVAAALLRLCHAPAGGTARDNSASEGAGTPAPGGAATAGPALGESLALSPAQLSRLGGSIAALGALVRFRVTGAAAAGSEALGGLLATLHTAEAAADWVVRDGSGALADAVSVLAHDSGVTAASLEETAYATHADTPAPADNRRDSGAALLGGGGGGADAAARARAGSSAGLRSSAAAPSAAAASASALTADPVQTLAGNRRAAAELLASFLGRALRLPALLEDAALLAGRADPPPLSPLAAAAAAAAQGGSGDAALRLPSTSTGHIVAAVRDALLLAVADPPGAPLQPRRRLRVAQGALVAFSGLVTADMILRPPLSAAAQGGASEMAPVGTPACKDAPAAAAAAASSHRVRAASAQTPLSPLQAVIAHPLLAPSPQLLQAPPPLTPSIVETAASAEYPPGVDASDGAFAAAAELPFPAFFVPLLQLRTLRALLLSPGPLEEVLALAAGGPRGDAAAETLASGGGASTAAAAAIASAPPQGFSAEGGGLWELETLVVDLPLRRLAPPLDSIRPGRAFGMSRLPWFPALAYPMVLPLADPPLGPGVPGAGPEATIALVDAHTPLALAARTARRVGVVLGHSYLVLAEILPGKQAPPLPPVAAQASAGGQTPAAAPAVPQPQYVFAVPPPQRGRALAVLPLQFAFASVPARAPHVVDLRCLSRDVTPALPAVRLGPGPEDGVPLEMVGVTLALESPAQAQRVVAHLAAARSRITQARVDALLRGVAPPPLSLPSPAGAF